MKKRIDVFLHESGLAESRTRASDMVRKGYVFLETDQGLLKINSPSYLYNEGKIIIQENPLQKYVSRAGLKLEGALKHLKLKIEGWVILDVGQSTGGFTDCCLALGAHSVVGIDVGKDQLHEKLRQHKKVRWFEGLNVKNLSQHEDFLKLVPKSGFDLTVVDVSFISLTQVLDHLLPYSREMLCLVKPQFEVGRQFLNKEGLVKDEKLYIQVEEKIKKTVADLNVKILDYFPSEVEGKDGNREFFIYLQKDF